MAGNALISIENHRGEGWGRKAAPQIAGGALCVRQAADGEAGNVRVVTSGYQLIDLPDIQDKRGHLTFLQDDRFPFAIRRMFVLFGLPEGTERGGHAHREQYQIIMMMTGSCSIRIDDGAKQSSIVLDRPTQVLYVPPRIWLDLKDFTAGAVCAVLTSDLYSEADYIRDHAEFMRLVAA